VALNDPALREEAAEVLRGLIDEIRLAPAGDGGLQIELFGELAAIMALRQSAKTNRAVDQTARFSLVSGRRNCLTLLLAARGIVAIGKSRGPRLVVNRS